MSSPSAVDPGLAAELLSRARAARPRAYAPYSGFPVGAALLDESGAIHTGVNVENAAYGLSICAERSAVARAVGEGARRIRAIAIAGPEDDVPCMPCGSCRQVLHELGSDLIVIVPRVEGGARLIPLEELLPEAFDARRLGGGEGSR